MSPTRPGEASAAGATETPVSLEHPGAPEEAVPPVALPERRGIAKVWSWLRRPHRIAPIDPDSDSRPKETALFREIVALRHRSPSSDALDEIGKYQDDTVGRIARSKVFEWSTIFVIVLNALAIGWDVDYTARFGKDDNLFKGPVHFAVIECFFCAYFTVEISIRFFAYRVKVRCLRDAWFVFDSLLVLMMIIETLILPFTAGGGPLGGLNILRLLRLLRITRMAKLMKAFPQLMMIVKGIAAATRAVAWTGILLVIVTYTWAILFTNEYHQGYATDAETKVWADTDGLADPAQYGMNLFGSMGKSMFSLLVMGTILDDVTSCTNAIRRTGNLPMLAAFIVYILLSSFTMMNMLVGILVEVVASTAEGESNRIAEAGVRDAIGTIFQQMDRDQSGAISKEEFAKMKTDTQVVKALQELGVKGRHFDMYVHLLFQPGEDGTTPPLSYKNLIDCIVRLRPGTAVNALDFASFKQSVMQSHALLRERIVRLEGLCSALAEVGGATDAAPRGLCADRVLLPPLELPWRRDSQGALEDLEGTPTEDIMRELQRRLGSAWPDEAGAPLGFPDEGLRRRSTPGLPGSCEEEVPEWGEDVLTC